MLIINPYKVQDAVPAIPTAPPLTDVNSFWSLWSFINDSDPGATGVTGETDAFPFSTDAPFPLIWATGASQLVNTWNAQGGVNIRQTDGAKKPTLDVTNHEIDFDGATACLASQGALTLGKQLSGCLLFKAGSLVETSVLFETGNGNDLLAGGVRARMTAGVLTFSVADQTPILPLLNTKIKTISDNNYHVLTFTINTEEATAANQVQIWVDGSQTGVTAPISTDLADEDLLSDILYVGARDQSDTRFTGSMKTLGLFNAAWDTTTRQSFETFLEYLRTQ